MYHRSIARFLVSAVFAAALLSGQQPSATNNPSLTISQSSLTSGGIASINYCNAALANQVVTIDVDNGMRHGTETAVIEILLDANGVGTGTWQVPAWMGANFNAPGVSEVHRVIM
tara:strand:+ start:96 stop:440 length:345 start_codon:yes stop_codon:yes gene_type:complete